MPYLKNQFHPPTVRTTELTWDLVGQSLFLAAIFLIVLGFGRIFATISAIELHLRRTKGDKTQQRRKKMKAASPIIFEGMIGVLVGDVIIVVLILSGIFTGQSWQILVTLGAVFLALVIILDVVLRYLEEGRKNAP